MLLQTVKCDGFEADWLNNSTAAGRPLALEAQSMGSQRCDRVQFQGMQYNDKMLFVMCFLLFWLNGQVRLRRRLAERDYQRDVMGRKLAIQVMIVAARQQTPPIVFEKCKQQLFWQTAWRRNMFVFVFSVPTTSLLMLVH